MILIAAHVLQIVHVNVLRDGCSVQSVEKK
jgi:hypothetical protein